MPLTSDDVQTGDIILCYGWNKVGVSQGVARTLNRVTVGAVKTVREVAVAVPNAIYHGVQGRTPRAPVVLELGDPVGIGSGSASANHALIVGPGDYVERDYKVMETADDLTARRDRAIEHANKQRVGPLRNRLLQQAAAFQPEMTTKKRRVLMPAVCHSTGLGFIRESIDRHLENSGGSFAVFRMQADGNDRAYALLAGCVAQKWAAVNFDDNEPPGDLNYSRLKAFMSALGSHTFGPGASNRAALYRTYRNTIGGPTGDSSTADRPTKKGFFCSMFVIACYQAASPDDAYCRKYLALDAKYTTPMALDGYLRSNRTRWRLVASRP